MRPLSRLLCTLTLGAAAFAAQAESYDGVHQGAGLLDRDAVAAQAVATARAPDQNVVRGSRGADPLVSTLSRESVRQAAVAAAHAPDQNVNAGSRVNSVVVPTMSRAKAQALAAPDTRL